MWSMVCAPRIPGWWRSRRLPCAFRERLLRLRWIATLRAAHLSVRSISLALAWSVVSFGATLARIYLCFRALDIRLAPPTFIAVVGLSSLAGLLSVSGIG